MNDREKPPLFKATEILFEDTGTYLSNLTNNLFHNAIERPVVVRHWKPEDPRDDEEDRAMRGSEWRVPQEAITRTLRAEGGTAILQYTVEDTYPRYNPPGERWKVSEHDKEKAHQLAAGYTKQAQEVLSGLGVGAVAHESGYGVAFPIADLAALLTKVIELQLSSQQADKLPETLSRKQLEGKRRMIGKGEERGR